MPSLREVGDRDMTVRHTVMVGPPGHRQPLAVDFYINRVNWGPARTAGSTSNGATDPYEASLGVADLMKYRAAAEFCEIVAGWDLTGPLADEHGNTLVGDEELIPLDPKIVQYVPLPLTNQIQQQLLAIVVPQMQTLLGLQRR